MERFASLSVRAAVFGLLLLALASCDLFDSGGEPFDVPPERLVAMVAVYDSGEDPVHRLVVADFENPSDYKVLTKAGTQVGGTCFSPDKRRILFADHEDTIVGTRARLKLYNLDTDQVRALDAPMAATHDGSLECTWRAGGSGFYYQADGAAGATYPIYYDLKTGEARPFGLQTGQGIYPTSFHGLKGRDTLLVNPKASGYDPDNPGIFFYFLHAQTGEKLERIENEYLQFIPWEDESRGGWKQAAYHVAYSDITGLIAFERRMEGRRSLAVTDLEGSLLIAHSGPGVVRCLRWVGKRRVLFDRHPPTFDVSWSDLQIMVWNTETNEVQELIAPEAIDGAMGLHLPDY